MSPDSATVLFLFYQYNFVVGLLHLFMINAHELGSNFPGAGTFSRDLTKTRSPQCLDFTWTMHMEKSISPLFLKSPRPRFESLSLSYTFRILATIHHHWTRCGLHYQSGMDKTENWEITKVSHDVPTVSVRIYCYKGNATT